MIRAIFRMTRLGIVYVHPSLPSISPAARLVHDGNEGSSLNPVAVQMTNYALSHARSQKSDESYAQGMLILEQCLSTQCGDGLDTPSENSKGTVLLGMATLLADRGNCKEAIERLQTIEGLNHSYLNVRVAAIEALVGLNLELDNDETSTGLADKCKEITDKHESTSNIGNSVAVNARAMALKGLVQLVCGDLGSADACFQGFPVGDNSIGSSATLSYGELLHSTRNFSSAKKVYQNVIQSVVEKNDSSDIRTLAACNMASDEVLLAATCALGQLESHTGNFVDAEDILTQALTKTEEKYGTCHPKVGVLLTCLALMFRHKAKQEHSSSLLIQEGLYRKAIDLLKAPTLESEETTGYRRDIVALARGGYAEALIIQQNRKNEGEKMKKWAEATWRNRRLSLAQALDFSESSIEVPIIDARISRIL